MVNYKTFNNYDEFKELFGLVKHGETATRKNKILLSLYKSGSWFFKSPFLNIKDMAQLESVILNEIQLSGAMDNNLPYTLSLMDYTFSSNLYKTDHKNGICEDGTIDFVRYYNIEASRIYKMRVGKLLRSLILETELGRLLPHECINYICEQFTNKWKAFVSANGPKNKLHVDSDFKKIYSSEYLKGDFGSCMVDRGRSDFYKNAVSAKAAYLENPDGKVVARAIIFIDVTDQDGKKWKLCERQYSSDGDTVLKQMLVDALYEGDFINGHKTVGASCHDSRLFVDRNGTSLADHKFSIECNLDGDDVLSYADSFKYYNMDNHIAYNHDGASYDYCLDTTDYSLYDEYGPDEDYDSWHECNCRETTTVYYNGEEYRCDVERMDDFRYVRRRDEYHHYEDVVEAEDSNNDWELYDDCYHSSITGKYYYHESNMREAEQEYEHKNQLEHEVA